MEKNSKIYVAGHNGLVGTALMKALRARGYSNFVVRSLQELDLTNQAAVAAFFEEENPEYVLLAAAKVGGIVANNTYRGQFIYENLMIQNNVIHQSYVHGVKKLLFLGSTCIYPKLASQPIKEEALLTGVLEETNEPYAIAKIAGLKMCENYNRQYGTSFISVMPTNLYGPKDNFDLEKSHVLPALLRKIYLGKCMEENDWDALRADFDKNPVKGVTGKNSEDDILKALADFGLKEEGNKVSVEIWGSGSPLREFMYSEEMAEACVHVLESEKAEKMVKADPSFSWINIGTGDEISIKGLAELIKKKVGFTGDLVFNTDKPDGTPRKLINIDRLTSLGYKRKIGLEEGIEKVFQHYLS